MKKRLFRVLLWVLLILIVLAIQSLLSMWSIKLNLAILPIYYLSMKKGLIEGLSAGIFTGVIQDSLAGGFIGPSVLANGLSAVGISYVPEVFYYWQPLLGISAMFLGTLFNDLVVYLCLSIFVQQPVPFSDFIYLGLGRALINCPFGLFISYKK